MKKYLLASDYDGTLYRQGKIAEETIRAINNFRQLGNLFAVVTGRDYAGSFELFKSEQQLPFDFVIASNGAIAYDKDGNIHFAEKIRREKSSGEDSKQCMY